MAAPIACYFAYIEPEEDTFVESSHARFDETVFDFRFEHVEHSFASLLCTLKSPGESLLRPGRQQHIWFALEFASSGIVPIFRGRVVAVPDDVFLAENQYLFRARPQDWQAQREALAAAVRAEGPASFDPAWVKPERREEPEAIFDALAKRWHINPTTHVVSLSGYNTGEDGTVVLGGDDLLQESLRLRVTGRALRQVNVTAEAQWTQAGAGSVDLWPSVVALGGNDKFETHTGEGLQRTWFKEGSRIGGDWTHGAASLERVDGASSLVEDTAITLSSSAWNSTYTQLMHPEARFPVWKFDGEWEVDYNTERSFKETLAFSLKADTQRLFDEDEDDDDAHEDINYASAQIGEPVDDPTSDYPDGAFPIRDFRRRNYFSTARGEESIRYLIACARANILESTRNVEIDGECDIEFAANNLTLRKDATFTAAGALASIGGTATGKIIGLIMEGNADDGVWTAGLTIGCTSGRGNTVTGTVGTEDYAEDYAEDQFAVVDEVLLAGGGDVTFEPPVYEPNDDGIDLFNMTPGNVLLDSSDLPGGLVVNGTRSQQSSVLGETVYATWEESAEALEAVFTEVCFSLKPLNTGPHETAIPALTVSDLMVPKTVDLEAGSA